MNEFDDRRKMQETKFAHEQDLAFKANARRNRLLGEWVGEKLGLTGDAVKAYVADVQAADLAEAGDEDVFKKVMGDLQSNGIAIDESGLRAKMKDLLEVARAQLQSGS